MSADLLCFILWCLSMAILYLVRCGVVHSWRTHGVGGNDLEMKRRWLRLPIGLVGMGLTLVFLMVWFSIQPH